jgi:hypothetical protein
MYKIYDGASLPNLESILLTPQVMLQQELGQKHGSAQRVCNIVHITKAKDRISC